VAFPIAPDLDQPLKPKGEMTPLPVTSTRPAELRHPTAADGRALPIIIDPRKPARADPPSTTKSAWEVVPADRPPQAPSTPPSQRRERSGSSVVARSVPAGGRSFVLRPAVLAAAVVLLALTVALFVLFSRPSDPATGAPGTTAARSDADPAADPGPVAAAPSPRAPAAPVPSTQPAPPVIDAGVPPAPPAPAPPPDAGAGMIERVTITLTGLPAGAAASLDGAPFAGSPLRLELPRAATPQTLRVTAAGFQDHESRIVPTADATISIPLVATVRTDAGATTTSLPAEPSDAGRRPHGPSGPRPPRDASSTRPPTPPTGTGLPLPETPPW
jgi:hypothetical protein